MTERPKHAVSKRLRRAWRGWIRPLVVVLSVLACFRSSVADWNDVPTQSMEPTIRAGDRIVTNKLAYGLKVPFTTVHVAQWGGPARGEVVLLYSPADGKRLVKRVVGVPGDRVELRDNRLVINGEAVALEPPDAAGAGAYPLTDPEPHLFATERYGPSAHSVMLQPARAARRTFAEVTVPGEHYLVMGDNRDNSGDSRIFGFVPRGEILGEVVGVAASFDRNRSWRPRWKRFLRGID